MDFSHRVVSWGYCEQKKEDIVLVSNRYELDWVWTRFGLGLVRADGMDGLEWIDNKKNIVAYRCTC